MARQTAAHENVSRRVANKPPGSPAPAKRRKHRRKTLTAAPALSNSDVDAPCYALERRPNLSRTTRTISVNVGGVAGVAGEHPDRDRAPGRVGEQPVLDLQLALLAVAGVAPGGQRAAPALQPGGGQVEQRHPRRIGVRGQMAAGQPGLDRVLPVFQPVHRGVQVAGGRAGDAQVGAERGVGPPVRVASLEAGATSREMTRPSARSRWAQAAPAAPAGPASRPWRAPSRKLSVKTGTTRLFRGYI